MPLALIVEDEWLVRAALADEMQRAGWHVLQASTGARAIELLRGDQHIDLLVTDIGLGDRVSGWEVAATFRTEHAGDPVIYASANAADPERQVSDSLFVTKPYTADDILDGFRKFPLH